MREYSCSSCAKLHRPDWQTLSVEDVKCPLYDDCEKARIGLEWMRGEYKPRQRNTAKSAETPKATISTPSSDAVRSRP